MGEKTPSLSNLVEELRALRNVAQPSTADLAAVWHALPTLLSALEGEGEGEGSRNATEHVAETLFEELHNLLDLDANHHSWDMVSGFIKDHFREAARRVISTHWQPLPSPPVKP